jgi:two-component system, NarL family, sensor kinase
MKHNNYQYLMSKKTGIIKHFKILLICASVSSFNLIHAQPSVVDSLNNLLNNKNIRIEEQLRLRQELCNGYIHFDLNRAKQETKRLIELSGKYNKSSFMATALKIKGNIFNLCGKPDSALYYYNLSLEICKKNNLKDDYFNTLNNIAIVLSEKNKTDSALFLYHQVLTYYESLSDKVKTAKIMANIGALYADIHNLDKAIEYIHKALKLQRETGNTEGAIVSLINLSLYEINRRNYHEGKKYGEEAIELSKNYHEVYYAQALLNTSICYLELKNLAKAFSFTNKAIAIYKQNNSKRGLTVGYRTLAECYISLKQYKQARKYCLMALEQADTSYRTDIRVLYKLLKDVDIHLNLFEEALYYADKRTQLLTEEIDENWTEKIADADAKYQSEKKEKEILRLNSEKQIASLHIKKRNILIYGLFIAIVLLFGIALLYFRHVRNKRTIIEQNLELQKQKVTQLENEKLLLATQSVLKGEENERKRLAQDLHDGLGGLLSGTKLALNNVKKNVVLGSDSVKDFNHALKMLENSIGELRRVAHNMMPEALLNLGLQDALKDFCDEIDKVNPIHILFQFVGEFRRVESALEINAYRIIQELINNAIKHSGAKELVLQMIQEKDRLCFIVQDDGKGFDSDYIIRSKGIGLISVKSRVELFKGRMEINSNPKTGTEITIEFAVSG